jgi:uncharacterized membrane protein
MSTFSLAHAAINTLFKSLSVFAMASAACRLGLQYNTETRRIDYVSLTFWLLIEAAVAVIAASISSYRVVVLDYLKARQAQQQTSARTRIWHARSLGPGNWKKVAKIVIPYPAAQLQSPSEQRSTRSSISI